MIKQNNNHISVPIKSEPGWNDSSCVGISENTAIKVDSSNNNSDESDDSKVSIMSNENKEDEDNNDTSEHEQDKSHNDEELSDEENSNVDFDAVFISFSNEERNTFNQDRIDDKTNIDRENTENTGQFSGDCKIASNCESHNHTNCSVSFFLETIHNMSSLLLFQVPITMV